MLDCLQQHLDNVIRGAPYIRAHSPGTLIATHFREHTEEALKVMGLQTNPGWSDSQRRRLDGQIKACWRIGPQCPNLKAILTSYYFNKFF